MIGVDKATIINMMRVHERAANVFSEVWNQGVDAGLPKATIKTNAMNASEEITAQGIAGLDKSTSKVKPFANGNPLPAAKVSPVAELAESLLFKYEGIGYRVGKRTIKGVWRVTLQNKNTKHPLMALEGQTVKITGDKGLAYGEFRVLKTGDTYANLEPIASATPEVVETTTPESSATQPSAELIAQVTAAVIAALSAK